MFKYSGVVVFYLSCRVVLQFGDICLARLERALVNGGHRDCFDIMADVLKSTSNGAKKTQIMYSCNLSFKQLDAYVRFLIRKGLLKMQIKKESKEFHFFETTEKGKTFLKAYKNLKSLLTI